MCFGITFVRIEEEEIDIPTVEVANCEMGNCGGPINITSFADSTNLNPVVPFPVAFNRGDVINIQGEYGVVPPNLVPDSVVVWHQVWAADWSGTVYESAPQWILNEDVGRIDGKIDVDYIIPDDAPFYGEFHDVNDTTAAAANHYIQVRVFYPAELELDVFWYHFVRIEEEQIPTVEVANCEMEIVVAQSILLLLRTAQTSILWYSFLSHLIVAISLIFKVNMDWYLQDLFRIL